MATPPGFAASASSRTTRAGSIGSSGSGEPSAARSSSSDAAGKTGRSSSESRKSAASDAVSSRSSRAPHTSATLLGPRQPADLLVRVADLREHLGRVLPERRRRRAVQDALALDRERKRDRRVRPEVLEDSERARLLVLGDLGDVLHGRGRDSRRGQALEPRRRRLLAQAPPEERDELAAVLDARGIRREARVGGEGGQPERVAERA